MFAGTGKIDITPRGSVWMDGMIRAHRSTGIHDPLHARALYLAADENPRNAFVLVAMDVVGLNAEDGMVVRRSVEKSTGIPWDHIILAASHTHSGPATIGAFNPKETKYVGELQKKLVTVIGRAAGGAVRAAAGSGSGKEDTISHYRRFLTKDGRVVMIWEPCPAEDIVGPLGEIDPELGVLKVTGSEGSSDGNLCIAFNHAGHPNVLSGENYLISGDYAGLAAQLVEERFGCTSMFLNGAQGTMDVDGFKDRDWEGRDRIGRTLADAVGSVAADLPTSPSVHLRGGSVRYTIPSRKISEEEYRWAEKILEQTGGKIQPLADGIGDDYLAVLFKRLRGREQEENPAEQVCVALDDSAFLSFPGELFTEIGMEIKQASPFKHTYIVDLANGTIGYVPSRKAIGEGGYAVVTRKLDHSAADLVKEHSLALLREVFDR
ncbi:MAG: neutral/alkaline non-lysosomal ceramidase N-terminal domain-containing protein [Spirochaetales bacterium]|nr:neutral/alkaline non-lysosomal ceramidase N-terminal domain-containing protein [Spirochaetales bacterium]